MSDSDVVVAAPIPITVDFTFTTLLPNTSAMQTAITANLLSFFTSGTSVGKDVSQIDYESIINSTLDSGGNPVISFAVASFRRRVQSDEDSSLIPQAKLLTVRFLMVTPLFPLT